MEPTTFIKLDRNILSWGWYKDANTFRTFIHLILNANIKEKKFEHVTLKRGQLIVSFPSLAKELGLSIQNIRTAINHLKSTGSITVEVMPKFQVISIVNYDLYQSIKLDNQQADNTPSTCYQHDNNTLSTTIKEIKNERIEEIKNERKGEDKRKETEFIYNNNGTFETEENSPTPILRGRFNNISLSETEFESLKKEESNYSFYIDKLSSHIESTGKSYKSHYATIISWIMEDRRKNIPAHTTTVSKDKRASYDIDAAVEKALTSVPEFKMREKR